MKKQRPRSSVVDRERQVRRTPPVPCGADSVKPFITSGRCRSAENRCLSNLWLPVTNRFQFERACSRPAAMPGVCLSVRRNNAPYHAHHRLSVLTYYIVTFSSQQLIFRHLILEFDNHCPRPRNLPADCTALGLKKSGGACPRIFARVQEISLQGQSEAVFSNHQRGVQMSIYTNPY